MKLLTTIHYILLGLIIAVLCANRPWVAISLCLIDIICLWYLKNDYKYFLEYEEALNEILHEENERLRKKINADK